MYSERVQLSGKDILEKNFKTGMRGYNQEEVDEFLDIVIQDYEILQQEIDRLTQENDRLKKNSDQSRARPSATNHQVNYDILKRLSNLEKAVFGKKFADS
ncbi:cell division regulator GpsB [Aquibacillus sp. 3ASR75-11]|uniref:Cell division regulator GpsB n=1 Tax=Terrihalobacillus insolitus TaxID=2950438 RepID=A0A9X4ANP5_9BACI|nr:cell division regulator GpsB [Terrihalobacillus insolitus]MDC3413006.1 cell division regulator GpsB [Terrihalobacillus insolitus]MDC3424748.1 cell division regulator GpsB [Terrihalobacillus insolitus]